LSRRREKAASGANKEEHAKNEAIMTQCEGMSDTTAADWQIVPVQRGITVSLDDCVKASAALAAEFGK
jgi:hypothetical protein